MSDTIASLPNVQTTGTQFQVGTLSASYSGSLTSAGWTASARLTDVKTIPSAPINDIDATEIGDGVETTEPGQAKPGDFEVELKFNHLQLQSWMALKGVKSRFRFIAANGAGAGWEGYIKDVKVTAEKGGLMKVSVTGKANTDLTPIVPSQS